MIAWVAARMDPGVYGERIAFQFPTEHDDPGSGADRGAHQPGRHDQRAVHAVEQRRLERGPGQPARPADRRRRAGLRRADLPPGRGRAVPRVRARDHGRPEAGRVRRAPSRRASRQLLGEAEPPPPEPGPEPPEPGESPEPGASPTPGRRRASCPTDVAELVAEAQRLYAEAQAALARGDLGTYQERIDELEAVLDAPRRADRGVGQPTPMDDPRPRLRWRASTRSPGGWPATRACGESASRQATAGRRLSAETVPDLDVDRSDGGRPPRDPRALRPRRHRSGGAARRRCGRRAGLGTHPRFRPDAAPPRACESSKSFAKRQMERAGVATAARVTIHRCRMQQLAHLRGTERAARREGRLAGRRQGRRRAGDAGGGGGGDPRTVRRRGAGRPRRARGAPRTGARSAPSRS